MKKADPSKILFYCSLYSTILLLTLSIGLYCGIKKNFVYGLYHKIFNDLKLLYAEKSTLTGTTPSHFLQKARKPGAGVTINEVGGNDLILLSGFFDKSNELRLIRRDGTVLKKWKVAYSHFFPKPDFFPTAPNTDWNIDTHGALILPDGSVVFNYEYGGTVKLDKLGNLVWKVRKSTHHSLEVNHDGSFWVPGRIYASPEDKSNLPFPCPHKLDSLIKISRGGEVLREISVPGLFMKNGLESLLTSNGRRLERHMRWDEEIVHLNKIVELSPSLAPKFDKFQSGDLLLSLRTYNMLLVVSPESETIKWWHIGPWKRQHDPEFAPDGTITVFNNNSYYLTDAADFFSNIIKIDPITNESHVILGHETGVDFASKVRGKHQLTPSGGLFITEFEGGRVFETDKSGKIIWEYINRYDNDNVAEITEARVYPADYFEVKEWAN
ncbi:hypothetical protein GM415_03425 [Pseudodesulfovibrio cashew]|uniref:Aryl sulfotransferase n=1 Tax=Pseudodesulfovibrio cashew TaxID=2678688 RepID=A0A6I6JFL5_9BACT|nr:arylsulfotransferase family protein [Pseudodesulfovibrio cashew]QGY39212.1 hypothetical protein GM415_03425 [Pseudodesulfovibrio cashew]